MFDPARGRLTCADVTDGRAKTVVVVEAADPVPWARPGARVLAPKGAVPRPPAAGVGGVTNVLLADGSVRRVDVRRVSERTLRNAFTRNDGEPLGVDW